MARRRAATRENIAAAEAAIDEQLSPATAEPATAGVAEPRTEPAKESP